MQEYEDSLFNIRGIPAEARFSRIVGSTSGDPSKVEDAPETTEVTESPGVIGQKCLVDFRREFPSYDEDSAGGRGALLCGTTDCRLNPDSGEILIMRPDQVPAWMALRCNVWNEDPSNVINLRPIPNEMLPQGIRPEATE